MMPEQQQRILGYFIEEAKDHLNTIEQGLLDLQATIEDPETVNEVFRAAHSVKGGAAMLGINSIQRTSHRLEDYFKVLKESPAKVDRTLESMFLQVFDGLQSLLEELQGPFGLTEDKAQEVMTDLEPVFGRLEQHLNVLVANSPIASVVVPTAAPVTAPEPQRAAASTSEASALNLVFKSDVPSHLRAMLALFKQADTDTSRGALQACCDSLERIGEQFDLHLWCELTSVTRQVVGNPDQTYRSLAPVVIKELKQAQEQVLAGQAEAISISSDLQALMPPVVEPEAADIDALFADTLSASEEAVGSPLNLFDEDQPAPTDTADLEWLEAAESETVDEASADIADDFMSSLESLNETDAMPLTSANTEEPSVGVSELNSLADLFEGEIANLESPWEEIAETGEETSDTQGPDISIPDDFSDLLESTLEDEPSVEPPSDLTDLFSDAIAEGDSTSPVEAEAVETASENVVDHDDFTDLFDLSESSTNDTAVFASPAVTSDGDNSLDALLDDIASDTDRLDDAAPDLAGDSDVDDNDELGIDAAFNDLGELFEEGSNTDLAEDDLTLAVDSSTPAAVEDLPTAAESEVLTADPANEEAISNTVDTAGASASERMFGDIDDPWATEESEVDIPDESALDALDELWSESHDGQEEESRWTETTAAESTTTTSEADEFSDFEALDLADPAEASERSDDDVLSEAETSDEFSALFGDSSDDDVDTLLTSMTQDSDDFSELFEESDSPDAGSAEFASVSEVPESEPINLSDRAAMDEDRLDFDALMSSDSDTPEDTVEPTDPDFEALLGDNLDEFNASIETADIASDDDIDGLLETSADDIDSPAENLDDLLGSEGAEASESELRLEELDVSAVSADESSEVDPFEALPDFEDPLQAVDSLFAESSEDAAVPQDAPSSESDLLFDDLTADPLPGPDPTQDLSLEDAPSEFDDLFEGPTNTSIGSDIEAVNTPANDLDDLFEGALPAESAIDSSPEATPLTDTDALHSLFDEPEEVNEAPAIAGAEAADTELAEAADTDLFDLEPTAEAETSDLDFADLDDESASASAIADSGLDDFLGEDFLSETAVENEPDLAVAESDDFFMEATSTDSLADSEADIFDLDLSAASDDVSATPVDTVSIDDMLEVSTDESEGELPATTPAPEDITDFFDENPSSIDEASAQSSDELNDFFGAADDEMSLEASPDGHQALEDTLDLAMDAVDNSVSEEIELDANLFSDSADALDLDAADLSSEVLPEDSDRTDALIDLFDDAPPSESEILPEVSSSEVDLPLDSSDRADAIDTAELFGGGDVDSEIEDLFGDDDAPPNAETVADMPAGDADILDGLDDLDVDDRVGESDRDDEMTALFGDASESDADDSPDGAIAHNQELDSPDGLDLEGDALFGGDDLDSEMADLFSDSPVEPSGDTVVNRPDDADSPELDGSDESHLEADDLLENLSFDDALASPLDEGLPEAIATEDKGTADASDDGFEDLESLLGDEDSDQPITAEPFNDLDALLSDEPDEPSGSASFDELGVLLEENAAASPESPTSETDDFGELEALLGEETGFSETAAVTTDSDAEDEFSDLEKLLEEADQTLGGSSPTIRAAKGSRASRRVGAMVDKTMRVSVKHLDILNNLVGELVVNRNSLEQDQERLRQFLDNLLFQVQQLNDVGQRMRDLYERSLLESSLMSSRQSLQGTGVARISESHGGNGGTTGHATGATFDALEMDRFTGFHTLSQEMIELIVRVRESASDIGYTVESSDQITRQFRQVTTQLQEGLNKARMVPFAQTADRLPRAVRDISLKCGKEARLVVEGRDTLIDKMILERLYDPMTHLVNNAITHGIETPEERAALGKSREGVITVRAFYQGNQTVIYIADDGAGIDPDFVKRKAVSKGILTPADANEMSILDTYELLFRPGFSTRDQADAFAGRGVGMDVVRTALSEIRGSITIDSELGKGTSFTIRLPLTLSISKALSCLNNQARIAFPMDGVEDMFDVPKDRIHVDEDEQTSIQWRDTRLTFQPLSELLQFNRSLGRGRVYGGNQDEDAVSIVVLRSANTFIGLQVDRVLGEQEIVIKQLEGPVPKPMGIAGATVLGDGRVMPIADVLELIDIAQGRVRREAGSSLWTQAEEPPAEPLVETKSEPTVLIVDDSITVRELLSMSFNKVGYRVEQARDGQEAWEKLRSGLPCDLVFCDIEMPRMDGLELLSRLQKDTSLKRIPIAMLTSRGADRHRQMALDLGANGYFTKPYLEEALLDAAQRMLNGEVLLKAE